MNPTKVDSTGTGRKSQKWKHDEGINRWGRLDRMGEKRMKPNTCRRDHFQKWIDCRPKQHSIMLSSRHTMDGLCEGEGYQRVKDLRESGRQHLVCSLDSSGSGIPGPIFQLSLRFILCFVMFWIELFQNLDNWGLKLEINQIKTFYCCWRKGCSISL